MWVSSCSQLGLCLVFELDIEGKLAMKFRNEGRTLLLSKMCIDVGF